MAATAPTTQSKATVVGMVLTFANYTFREMISNRLLVLIALFAILGLGLASFLAEVAITEHEQVQLALVAALYRFCAVFLMMVFVVSSIVREFNDKCLELYLAMPISRTIYFAGKVCGFILCGFVLSLVFAAVMLLYTDWQTLLLWCISLTAELAIVSVFAFFAVLTFNQQITASVFITFFFYMLSRMTDTIQLISESPIMAETLGNNILEFMLSILRVVLPRLSNFTQTDWLVYGGGWDQLPLILGATVVYCFLLGAMAMWDFMRKNI